MSRAQTRPEVCMGIMNCTCLQGQTKDRELVTFVCEKMPFRWLRGVKLGTAFAPAPSKARPVILDFLLNHFVLPKYNWNEMQRRVRCSVGWPNSPGLFLLALAGNLVQSRCHQWLRMFRGGGDKWYRSKCREVACIPSSQVLGITSRGHPELLVYLILGKQSEQWKSQSSAALGAFFPSSFFLHRCV